MRLQPDHLIKDSIEENLDLCLICGNVLDPVFENNGFDEHGATKIEFAGYKLCDHKEVED